MAKTQEYDLEIRPTKFIKGQGLAKMLTEGNEILLGMDVKGNLEMIYTMLDKLEWHELYADIIYYLKNLTCPDHLVNYKRRALRLKASKLVDSTWYGLKKPKRIDSQVCQT